MQHSPVGRGTYLHVSPTFAMRMASTSEEVKELGALVTGLAGLGVNAPVAKDSLKLLSVSGRNGLGPRRRLTPDAHTTSSRQKNHG